MRKRDSATLSDVARHAGVSVMSVSAVLNNANTGTRVGQATRERILLSAKELGYRPNRVAQSLRQSRSNILGVFSEVAATDDPCLHHAEVLRGLMKGAAKAGTGLLFCGPDSGQPQDGDLLNGHHDGIIVFASPSCPAVERMKQRGAAMVAHTDAIPGVPSVVVDDFEGGRLQARHLAERGRTRVLYRPGHLPFVSGVRRYESFLDEAARLGMQVITGDRPASFSTAPLKDREKDLLLSGQADSIVCFDDHLAYLTLRAVEALGLRVPEQVALVGFNGIHPGIDIDLRVTTIQAPWKAMAEFAVLSLVRQLGGQEARQETVMPVSLLAGSTS